MKKFKGILLALLSIACVSVAAAGFVGCGDEESSSQVTSSNIFPSNSVVSQSSSMEGNGSSIMGDSSSSFNDSSVIMEDSSLSSNDSSVVVGNTLTFKTLTVAEDMVHGTISNTMEVFSFNEEILVTGKTRFEVSMDEYGINTVLSKTIPLSIGDNTVYVWEIVEDEVVRVYKVIIRRRPTYQVAFITGVETEVATQTVEETFCAIKPTDELTKQGYIFGGWDYNFELPITANITINAIWIPSTETPYIVEHYFQNISNDEYTLQINETQTLKGTTGMQVQATPKSFEHFTYIAGGDEVGEISPDGSLVLKVYYTRNTYQIQFDGNGGELLEGEETQTVRYGGAAIAPTYTRIGYEINNFDGDINFIEGNSTFYAQWNLIQYQIQYELDGATNHVENPSTYTILDLPLTLKAPTKDNAYYCGLYSDATYETPLTIIEEIGGAIVYAKFITTDGLNYQLTRDNNGYEVIGYTGSDSDVYIANTYNGLPVVSIGNSAFADCSIIVNVKMPESITNIGESAFRNCSRLVSVEIPDSVTAIGREAFCRCISLTSSNIPNDITLIDSFTFTFCSSLTSIVIPDSVTTIGSHAFYNCDSLTSIDIPDSVTTIGGGAFNGCDSLTSIKLSDNIEIGEWAFLGTGYYNDADNWENEALYLGEYLIAVKDTLQGEYQIKEGTRYLANRVFGTCLDLTAVIIPDGIIKIPSLAFYECINLTSIDIPDSVITIGSLAFHYCYNLTNVVIPDSVTTIGYGAFADMGYSNEESNWENDVLYIGKYLIDAKDSISGEYIIKEGTSCIADNAFADCSSLISVIIPDSVTSVGTSVFFNCSSLTSVTIGNGVTTIGDSAFRWSGLTKVMLPDSLITIGKQAFEACYLTSIEIPDSVTTISEWAFNYCTNLTNITFEGTVEQWNTIAKGSDWNNNVPATEVVCSDGTVAL